MTIDKIKKEIDRYVDNNFDRLHEDINFVVGVSRGGLIPASLIATKLDKPLVAVYIDREDNIFLDQTHRLRHKNLLIVDDIRRSGKTLFLLDHHIRSLSEPNNIKYLTVYSVPDLEDTKYQLNTTFIRELKNDISFPWDYPRIHDNNA